MIKFSIQNLIDFKRKSIKSKNTYLNQLTTSKAKPSQGGGNYWITSSSAISIAYRRNDNEIIKNKISDLTKRKKDSNHTISKDMYQRNINILENYVSHDFSKWLPNSEITFLKNSRKNSILDIKGIPIQILPSVLFTYKEKGVPTIGATWFVSKLEGFSVEELGLFTESLYRFLSVNYSKDYQINVDLCLTVDTFKNKELSYKKLLNGKIPLLLDSTLDEIISISN